MALNVQRAPIDSTFGGLVRAGETPAAALARIERLPGPDHVRVIESDEGQQLLAEINRQTAEQRRLTRRLERAAVRAAVLTGHVR